MTQFFRNEYLFSEIYLQEITQLEEDPTVKATLLSLKEYRDYANTSSLEEWNESFVHEILNALRFGVKSVDGNTALLSKFGAKDTITLCYSLLPSEDLNSTTMGHNWSEKIIRNLRINQLRWGILTNGDRWRIYHTEEPTPYENYLEIDLKGIMDSDSVPQYQIFNKFMKAENFVSNNDKNCEFDLFKKESQDRINYIEEELKNALKQKEEGGKGILSNICMGYVDYLRKHENPDFSDELLRDSIYAGAMLYMFRLLFLFYAKARRLLKESNRALFADVLRKAQKIQNQKNAGKGDYSLWNDLRELFSNIDITYNGGLFNPTENEFVEEKRLSNIHLAPVLYFMTYYEDNAGNVAPISYRDMGVRHLGSLYEGLLEHKLFITEEDTEVQVTNNDIKFIPASKGGMIVSGKYIPKGKVYFGNDKGMRKASGSYYTPENVVDYIARNTVGIKLYELNKSFIKKYKNEIRSIKTAISKNEEFEIVQLLKETANNFILDKVLKLSVLDPAMGSGHFLVFSTNLISNFITDFLNSFNVITDGETSTTYWRRKVVENCIYGVDINPLAVELAKLSLWILSMSKKKPLSFLDHHLKSGNSLIGAQLKEIGHYPKEEKGKSTNGQLKLFDNNKGFDLAIDNAINNYKSIQLLETRALDDIEDKKYWLENIHELLKPYKSICDFHTGVYFNENISEYEYEKTIKAFSDEFVWNQNTYFHWELEFPTIFLVKGGFDVVITNPPYLKERDNRSIFEPVINSSYRKYHQGKMDYWYFFLHLSIDVVNTYGMIGFITNSYWTKSAGAKRLIKRIKKHLTISKIVDFGKRKIFEGVSGNHMLHIYRNGDYKNQKCVFVNAEDNELTIQMEADCSSEIANKSLFTSDNKIQLTGQDDVLSNRNTIRLGELFEVSQGVIESTDKISKKQHSLAGDDSFIIGQGVFVLNENELDELCLSESELSIIKRYLNANDVERYLIKFNNQYLIYSDKYSKIDIENENYINIKEHLDNVQRFITSSNKPYGIHRPRVKRFFENPKLICKGMFSVPEFCYDESNFYVGFSFSVIIKKENGYNLKFLLAILNSKLGEYWFRCNGKKRGIGVDIGVQVFRNFPLPKIDINTQKELYGNLSNLSDQLLKVRIEQNETKDFCIKENLNSKIGMLEENINSSVYEIYGLSREEIEEIEGA